MKSASFVAGLLACLGLLFLAAPQRDAVAATGATAQVCSAAAGDVFTPPAETFAKKCSFNSDCPYGKCVSGQCGGCSFDSDCKGWGKCAKGQCGGCSFASDCKGFGSCSGGRCSKSPY